MAHYYDRNPTATSRPNEILCRFSDVAFSFTSDSNVFSRNQIDFGSRLLINTVVEDITELSNINLRQFFEDVPANQAFAKKNLASYHCTVPDENKLDGDLLDLGCGYGVVGIVLKRLFPQLRVTMSDVNNRALELCKDNCKKNRVSDVEIIHSDGWSGLTDMYSMILTNPPVRAGKKMVFSFYDGAFEHLKKNGRLYVVLRKKQGADSSMTYLENLFGNCCVLNKESGYRILMAEKEI